MGAGQPQAELPKWVGIVARVVLALGVLLLLGAGGGAVMSESLGMNLFMLSVGPLGFGVVATMLSRKTSRGTAGKPIGLGCLAGFGLSVLVTMFFAVIWPSL